MERVLQFVGARNLRDLGGYPTRDGRRTRWRTVYRSDCLDRIDAAGQQWLVEAGLKTVIDLRDHLEVGEHPNVFANSTDVRYQRVPMWDEATPRTRAPDFTYGYSRAVDRFGSRLVAVFEVVLAPGTLPAVIHCASGKDRTGIVAGLLLACVGVDLDVIAADYALSSTCLGPEYVVEKRQWVADNGYKWDDWSEMFHTPPERMLKTMAYVEEQYGGVEAYLVRHGLAPSAIATLREVLTEPCA